MSWNLDMTQFVAAQAKKEILSLKIRKTKKITVEQHKVCHQAWSWSVFLVYVWEVFFFWEEKLTN